MKVSDIATCIEEIAPLSLQEDYDNAGWQVGDKYSEATGALLCIDVTEEVVDEAISLGVNLIISHHPLLFKGVKSLTGKQYNIIYPFMLHIPIWTMLGLESILKWQKSLD